MVALHSGGTWELVPLLPDKKLLVVAGFIQWRLDLMVMFIVSSLGRQRIYKEFWFRSWFLFVSF